MNDMIENPLATFLDSFDAFAAESGRAGLAFDDEDCVTVEIGDDVLVNLSIDTETETVLAFATVGVADDTVMDVAELYLGFLKAHAYGEGTHGFTVGLESEESGRIVVQDRRLLAEFPDSTAVAAWIGACALAVRELRVRLSPTDPGRPAEDIIHP